jgi:hypothetical protein
MKFFSRKTKPLSKHHNKKGKKNLTRTEALACVPVRSEMIHWSMNDEGEVLVEYPISIKPFFIALAKRFNRGQEQTLTKKLQLDSTGSRVWQMIDNSKNVKSIIKEVATETGLSLQEAELSVTAFFRELGKRGVILLK